MSEAGPYAQRDLRLLKLEPHLHTLHSDGQDSVAAMFEACHSVGYDAVALTDHNTLSGLAEAVEAADRLGLILVPGVEVTTFRGHAVVLGVRHVPEWRDLEVRGMDALAAEVRADGGVPSVAHAAARRRPATYVYARERSRDGVLDALRQRRVVAASVDAPLEFWLERDGPGSVAILGEHVAEAGWTPRTSGSAQVETVELHDGRRA